MWGCFIIFISSGEHKTVKELIIEAAVEKLDDVLAFVDEIMEAKDVSPKIAMKIDVAVEELFVNIASYAYAPEQGEARIEVEDEDPSALSITFTDYGKPYDPLKKEDPDITLSAEERQIGGLGIFMVRKSMDEMNYEYRDGANVLTIKKLLA